MDTERYFLELSHRVREALRSRGVEAVYLTMPDRYYVRLERVVIDGDCYSAEYGDAWTVYVITPDGHPLPVAQHGEIADAEREIRTRCEADPAGALVPCAGANATLWPKRIGPPRGEERRKA